MNAEPRPARLRAAFVTPQADFYVRCHGTIPQITAKSYRLRIVSPGTTPLDLSLDELRTGFPERRVTAVLQCAGNRRADMLTIKCVPGDPWGPGAISNAEWAGVGLGDVLRAAGVKDDPACHVAFACHDEIDEEGERFTFGVSIPLAKAMAPETLLALAMNGEPLTPAHGFPLRVVTPGYAGARSPKWLASITVQECPCGGRIQQNGYKLFPAHVTKVTADFDGGVTINEMPITSAICEPAADATLPPGPTTLRGYAVASGRPIARVDVSCDGGTSWHQAELEPNPHSPWSWTLWAARLHLPPGERELVVRAWDAAGETQPSSTADLWNFPGYLSRAWHRVKVTVA